jgi:site-specific DNA-methyltransferase (adenine-specific)
MTKLLQHIKAKPHFMSDDFVLYQGDSIEHLNQLPEGSVDMIFADPPYNLSNGGFTVHAGKMVSVDKGDWDKSKGFQNDYDFHLAWLKACHRVLKDEGTIWVSGTYHSIYQCGSAMQQIGYHILNDISWFKPNASPNLSCRFFTASHETLIWARKSKKAKHHFDYKAMKEGEWAEDLLKKPNLQMRSVWAIVANEELSPSAFWSAYPPLREEKLNGKHPTQKPIELLRRCIIASTKKGDVIVDPFSGSSTTGIASKIVGGRKFIGFDLDKGYLDLSVKRYQDIINNKI